MRTLIKITGKRIGQRWNGGRPKRIIRVEESASVRSKWSGYSAKFISRNGYEEEDYIRQKEMNIPYTEFGTWDTKLYVNKTRYKKDPLHYHELVRNFKQ